MKKLGIVVGEEMWMFFREIFEDLSLHYKISTYRQRKYHGPILSGRLNRWLYAHGLRAMLANNDLCFFEWASEHLVIASRIPTTKPIVTRLHSFELYQWAPKVNWHAVNKVIFISKFMETKFKELYPDHSHKTVVINNGRSMHTFVPPQQRNFDYTLGMVCAISPVKRVYEVILAIYELRKRGLPVKLKIAGEPKAKDDFRYPAAVHDLVKKLNLEGSVIFDGFVKNTPAWLHTIDMFISNSFWEGQQVALIEAMASGCYCLSHIWNGAEEMLPAENLFITDAELQQKIIAFYELPEAEKISRSIDLRRMACEKYDIDKVKPQIHQIIQEIINN